jgi:hypothetical protein
MAQSSGSELGAIESQVHPVYHTPSSDEHQLGQYIMPKSLPVPGPDPGPTDFLRQAVAAVAQPAPVEATPRVAKPTEAINSFDPLSAKNRLAQEALLADPSEMRQWFPTLLKDVTLNNNDHLDMAEIDKGLQNAKLSEAERNFLTVLKSGYEKLSLTEKGQVDSAGVSAFSLAVIDKALDRKLSEDPLYSEQARSDIFGGVISGAVLGYSYTKGTAKERALGALAGSIVLTGLYEAVDFGNKEFGFYDNTYDTVEKNYKTFTEDFAHPHPTTPTAESAKSQTQGSAPVIPAPRS